MEKNGYFMEPVNNSKSAVIYPDINIPSAKESLQNTVPKDSAEISDTSKVFSQIDQFLNLGNPNRMDISNLNTSEKKEFLKSLAELLKNGIVGYEILNVKGRPEKHYIVTEIGDSRIKGAKLYKKDDTYNNKRQ